MYKKFIKSVAMYCIAKATQETTTGNYLVWFDDIVRDFGCDPKTLMHFRERISEEIAYYPCVSEVDYNKEFFDIDLYTDYCFNDLEEE